MDSITSPRCDVPVMTELERALWVVLSERKGRVSALTADSLSYGIFDGVVSPRRIRKTISRLVIVFGYPICATPSKPAGYFIAEKPEELRDHVDRLMRHAKIEIVHAVKLQPTRHPELIGQLMIDVSTGVI